MRRDRDVGVGDKQAASHAEVDKELGRLLWGAMAEGHDNGLADAADGFDGGTREGVGNLRLG